MFFLDDKTYRLRTVPPGTRTVRPASWSPLFWLTGASAFAAFSLILVALST